MKLTNKEIKNNKFLDMNRIAEVNSYIASVQDLIVKKGYEEGEPFGESANTSQVFFNFISQKQ